MFRRRALPTFDMPPPFDAARDGPLLAACEAAFAGPFRRTVLIANNPAVGRRRIERLDLRPDDLVLQFSRAIHFEALRDIVCTHAFLFIEADGSYHGFDSEGRPDRPYHAVAGPAPILAFKRLSPDGALPLVRPWLDASRATVVEFPASAFTYGYEYPEGRKPSTGLQAIRFLAHLNQARERRTPIHLVGFTSRGRRLHAWEWERRWIAAQPDVSHQRGPLAAWLRR
jgi:hypothetical protein